MFRMVRALGFFSCFFFLTWISAAAEPVVAFGLTNKAIGQAAIWSEEYVLEANDLRSNGVDGVSVHLGNQKKSPSPAVLRHLYFPFAYVC